MTAKEKIDIFQMILDTLIIDNNNEIYGEGICFYILNNTKDEYHNELLYHLDKYHPEIKTGGVFMWYPETEFGDEQRITLLRKIIKDLENEI